MDYKELIENLKNMLPEKILYSDLICAEGAYAHSGPLVYEDPEPYFIEQAITAITELIDRAEAAEQKAENSRSVVLGRWENFRGKPKCSHCKAVWPEDYFQYNFCPRCGANMRPENDG